MGVCNGFVIPIAQKFGARDYKTMRCYFANSIYLALGFSAVITTIVCIYCKKILVLMGTPDNIIEYLSFFTYMIHVQFKDTSDITKPEANIFIGKFKLNKLVSCDMKIF